MKSKKYFFTLHFLRNVLALYALTILKSQTQSTEKKCCKLSFIAFHTLIHLLRTLHNEANC